MVFKAEAKSGISPLVFERNIFDLLRLYAVLQVMISHIFFHLQVQMPLWAGKFFGVPGVIILFCLSGYLVTASLDKCMTKKSDDLLQARKEYLRKRALRIVPGLWTCLLVNTIIIAIIYDLRPAFKDGVIYIFTQFLGLTFYTGTWLKGYGVGAPNGSLWTIIIEVQFYIAIMIIWKKFEKAGGIAWSVLLFIGFVFNIVAGILETKYGEMIIVKLFEVSLIPYLYLFLIGACVYRFRNIVFSLKRVYYFGILIVLIVLKHLFGNIVSGLYTPLIYGICVALITMILGYMFGLKIRLPFDVTYGIYLYHMVIVNVFVEFGLIGKAKFVAICMMLSAFFGVLSWNLVEKRWIRKKTIN